MKKFLAIAFLVSGLFGSYAFASPSIYEMIDGQLDAQISSDYAGIVCVIGTFRVKAGMVDQLKAMEPEVIKVHKLDDSIIEFKMVQSLTDPQVYGFYARFGSIRGFKAHMKTMHSSELGQKLIALWEKDSLKVSMWRQIKI